MHAYFLQSQIRSVRSPVIPFRCIEITNVATGKKPVPPQAERRKGREGSSIKYETLSKESGFNLELNSKEGLSYAVFYPNYPDLTLRIHYPFIGLLFPSASGTEPYSRPTFISPVSFLLSAELSRGPLWPLSPHFRHPRRRAATFSSRQSYIPSPATPSFLPSFLARRQTKIFFEARHVRTFCPPHAQHAHGIVFVRAPIWMLSVSSPVPWRPHKKMIKAWEVQFHSSSK